MSHYLFVHLMRASGTPAVLAHLIDIGELRDYPTIADVHLQALCGLIPSQGWGCLSSKPDQDGPGKTCSLCSAVKSDREKSQAEALSCMNDKPADDAPELLMIPTVIRQRLTALRQALEQVRDAAQYCNFWGDGPQIGDIATDALTADDTAAAATEEQARATLEEFKALAWPGVSPETPSVLNGTPGELSFDHIQQLAYATTYGDAYTLFKNQHVVRLEHGGEQLTLCGWTPVDGWRILSLSPIDETYTTCEKCEQLRVVFLGVSSAIEASPMVVGFVSGQDLVDSLNAELPE